MQTTDNVGLKLYEGTDLFNPLVVENPNCETLDEVIKAISDQAVGSATELVTGTVHALTRGLDDGDRDVFIFTATSNFTAGDTFTLDGQQVSALTVAGTQLASNCYIIGSSVLVHKRDTLLTFYVSETTAKDAEKLGGELPSYYATDSDLDAAVADISALATKVGTAVLTTQAPDLSGAVNELNTQLTNLGSEELLGATTSSRVVQLSGHRHYYVCVGVTQSSTSVVRVYASTLLIQTASGSVVCKYTTDGGVVETATYNMANNTLTSSVNTLEAMIIGVD